MSRFFSVFSLLLCMSTFAPAGPITHMPEPKGPKKTVGELMDQLKKRVRDMNYGWRDDLFTDKGWQQRGYTVNGLPLIYWTCGDPDSNNRSLVLSAVHGDEITPIYFGVRLVEYLRQDPTQCKGRYVIVAPTVNPDGFLRYRRGTRTNFNKVDVNRNFETEDWWDKALHLWKTQFGGKRRRYPGPYPASEPETIFQQWLIEEFRPTKILSIHAPLKILDYDGPQTALARSFSQSYMQSCETLRQQMAKATPLRHYAFGYFPGSLGNYAGKQRGIPTITAELPSIDASKAAHYFTLMEKSLDLFFDFQVQDSPYAQPPQQARGDTPSDVGRKN